MNPTEARTALETARTEAEQAREVVELLAERVRDGAADVTAEELASRRGLAELAELRVTAAERKLAAALAADLDARARAMGDRIRALVDEDTTAPLIDAVRAVMAAVQDLAAAAADRTGKIRTAAMDGVALNDELGRSQDNPFPSRTYGYMAQSSPSATITALDGGSATAFPVGNLLGLALAAALPGDHDVRRSLVETLTRPPEGIEHLARGVPGLPEALRIDRETWETLPPAAQREAARQGRQPAAPAVGREG
ncbi:hypothetical protein GCM10009731_09300 [Streptomyces globosus]